MSGSLYDYDDELGAYYYPSQIRPDDPNRFSAFKFMPAHAKPDNMYGQRMAMERQERDGLSKYRGLAHDNDSFVPPQRMNGEYVFRKRRDAYIDRMRSMDGGGGFSAGPDVMAMPRPHAVREMMTRNRVYGELSDARAIEAHGHRLEAMRQRLMERRNEWVSWMVNNIRREAVNPGTVEENIDKLRMACGVYVDKIIDRLIFLIRFGNRREVNAEAVEEMMRAGVQEVMTDQKIPSRRDMPYFYWTKRNARYPWWGTDYRMRLTLS